MKRKMFETKDIHRALDGKHVKFKYINIGKRCNKYECPLYRNCKYTRKKYYRMNKWILSRKTDSPIRIAPKLEEDFSGTTTCPHKMPRLYSCYDCKYFSVDDDMIRICTCKDRHVSIEHGGVIPNLDWYDYIGGKTRCPFFDLSAYGNDWDRNTGERLLSDPETSENNLQKILDERKINHDK